MPVPWDKVIPQRPHMIEAARGWYDKWIRGDRPGVNERADDADKPSHSDEEIMQVEAYAEPIMLYDGTENQGAANDVASRLESLEFSSMAQSETLKNLTEQNQEVTHHLSELQQALGAANQRLQEVRAAAQAQRTSIEALEMQVQRLSADMSRVATRINLALWWGSIGLLVTIAAIVAVVVLLRS